MSKITIKKILNKQKTSRAGNPYDSCSILTTDKEGNEVWLNSFSNSITKSWRDGDTVELEITKTEYGFKFKEPRERTLEDVFPELKKIVEMLESLTIIKTLGGEIDPTFAPKSTDVRLEELNF